MRGKLSEAQNLLRDEAASVYPKGVCASLNKLFARLDDNPSHNMIFEFAEAKHAEGKPVGSRTWAW